MSLLGEDPFARLDEGTEWQQPAVFLCSVCAWEAAGRPEEAAAAGHSLGEFAALVATGALEFEAAVGLVSLRGRLMAEAAASPPGGMLAMLGGDADAVAALAAELGLLIANDNAPGQVVLSGPREQIERATERGPAETGARVRPLAVSGAFHSAQMEPVVDPMREALAAAGFTEPDFPVYSCATAAPFEDPAEELARNIVRPVHWRETVLALRAAGIDDFSELGPGRVLTGLVRRIVPKAEPATEVA